MGGVTLLTFPANASFRTLEPVMTTLPTTEAVPPPPPDDLRSRSVAMHDDPRFRELRRRLLRFVVPMTFAFLAWYLLYVVMSGSARGVLDTRVVGSVNLALVFGVLQFVSTFGIAWWYSLYANRSFDPLADELRAELMREGPPGPDGEDRTPDGDSGAVPAQEGHS